MQGQAAALRGARRRPLAAIGSLDPFAEEADDTLRLLDSQRARGAAARARRRRGVRGAVGAPGQLRGLIGNSNEVFQTTAERNAELAEIFEIFPTFLRESRATLIRLDEFAADTDPLVPQLRPAARELSPTLIALGELAPNLEAFFVGSRDDLGRATRPTRPPAACSTTTCARCSPRRSLSRGVQLDLQGRPPLPQRDHLDVRQRRRCDERGTTRRQLYKVLRTLAPLDPDGRGVPARLTLSGESLLPAGGCSRRRRRARFLRDPSLRDRHRRQARPRRRRRLSRRSVRPNRISPLTTSPPDDIFIHRTCRHRPARSRRTSTRSVSPEQPSISTTREQGAPIRSFPQLDGDDPVRTGREGPDVEGPHGPDNQGLVPHLPKQAPTTGPRTKDSSRVRTSRRRMYAYST